MPGLVGGPSVGDRVGRVLAGTPIRDGRRWLGPLIAAIGAAILIWLAMPHVPWYLKLPLALLALGYVGAQSAAYLGHREEADRGDPSQVDGDSPSPLREGRGGGLVNQGPS